jgi:hypothetical protein
MFFSKRALRAVALAAAAVVLTPAAGFCVEEDLYIYRLLFARVYFEYETGTADDNGRTTERQRFQQSYNLDTLGNILSRRLITYDAGVGFTFENSEHDSRTIDSEQVNYYLRTALLPKSNIPLTLNASRTNDTLTTEVNEQERTRDIYGLNWEMRFKTLPDTRIYIQRQHDTSSTSDTSSTVYDVVMTKTLGPTENYFAFNMSTAEDNLTGTNGSDSMTINATNKTALSRSTIFDIGLTRGESSTESATSTDTTVNALTMGLQSKPSLEFNQNHRFTHYNTSSDGSVSENSTYSGNMGYRFTDRLDSSLNLTVAESTSESEDKSQESTSLGTGFGLNYRISKKLSLSESVSYSKTDTTSDTPTDLDREIFRVLTHLNYNDQLPWAHLSSSVRVGYNRDKTTEELSGSGIEQGISASLTNIDVNRYFVFNMAADWSKVHNLTGDVWSDSNSFHLSAINKLWRRYVQLAANFSKSSQSSWVAASESSSENWSLTAASAYFRNTRLDAKTEYNKTFDTVTGEISTLTNSLLVTHNRYLANGMLDVGFDYSLVSSTFSGGSDKFSSIGAFARYNKQLIRNLDWRTSASISRGSGDDNNIRNITTFDNAFTYPLRAWLVSLEQKYISTETQNRDFSENTYLFRAVRQFLWFL